MVFACEMSAKAASRPNISSARALQLPTFKWVGARRLQCKLPDANGARPPRSVHEIKNKEAVRAETTVSDKKEASVKHPPATREEGGGEEKRKRKKEKMAEFRLTLTKDEIDEDFFIITGARAPRRPKRRPKAVQSKIESLFLGSLLPKTMAPDRYMVPD